MYFSIQKNPKQYKTFQKSKKSSKIMENNEIFM